MPIKILQTFSGSYHFIKMKQNKTINVYFQELSSICESEFKGLVHSKIKILSLITHPHVVPNP